MSTVNGVNQNGYAAYYQNSVTAKKPGARQGQSGRAGAASRQEAEYVKSSEAKKAESQQAELSYKAQKLLEKLQKKYGNMDFVVANYSSSSEAQSLMAGSSKEYSAVIEPELLEKMASDQEAYEKYTGVLDNAQGQLKDMVSQLGADANKVSKLGISMDKDGQVSYFAELEKSSAAQRERIEKSREEKRENAKAERKKAAESRDGSGQVSWAKEQAEENQPGVQRARVVSDSAEGLLELIRKFKFHDRQEQVGTGFDLSV